MTEPTTAQIWIDKGQAEYVLHVRVHRDGQDFDMALPTDERMDGALRTFLRDPGSIDSYISSLPDTTERVCPTCGLKDPTSP